MKIIGQDLKKAEEQAQANADSLGSPWWLFCYNGEFWLSKTPVHCDGFIREFQPSNNKTKEKET